jgi:TonB family protein
MGRSAAILMFGFSVRVLVGLAFLFLLNQAVWAQDERKITEPIQEAEIAKLAPLIYPPLARQTRITGDVELKLEVRPDGSVASVVVVKGHPLLAVPAQDNAKNSRFECGNCGEETRSYHFTYTFNLDQPGSCGVTSQKPTAEQVQPYPGISQTIGHVTVVDQPFVTCDPAGIITARKVRSAKCLYLWRCGKPRIISIE